MAHRLNVIPMRRCWLSLALVLIVGGCADSQGLSRDRLADTIDQEESQFISGLPAASAAPTRPNAPTLGLYLKPTGFLNREFEWTGQDRDAVLAWSQAIPLPSGGRSAGFLTLSSLKGHTLTELLASAKRYGIDWLLVFDGAAAVDHYNNYKAGLLYWTILGAYLADGTESDVLCLLKAVLWDVKTGARLFEEEAEAVTRTVGPAALVDDKHEIERARTTAMNLLMDRLKHRFAEVAATGR
ncbi:MAG TPA: hypothetical protein VL261_00615 [Nitrospira sp.]|nr:hypothetical protein [Nitrospira sp.]